MRKRKGKFRVFWSVVLIFALGVAIYAADDSYYFLKYGVGARALGMGGAFSAISDDATAPLWNPAGMVQYDSRKAAMMHGNQFNMDIYYNYVGYVQPVSYWGSFGFSYANLNTGFIPVTTQKDDLGMPIIDRYVSDNESAFVFSWAKALANKKASLGLNVKFLTQTFGDDHGRGVDMDLGFLFHATDSFAMSVVLQDFLIGKMNWDGEDDNLDLTVKTGISGRFFNNRVIVGLDTDFAKGRPAVWHIGAEYNINDSFALRFGSNDSNLTGGLSVKAKNWIFDYAYEDHDLGPTHRVSDRIDFDDAFPWRERYRERKELRPLEPAKKVLVRVEKVDTTTNPPTATIIEPKKEEQKETKPQAVVKVEDEKTKLIKYYEDMADRYAVAGKYDEAIPIYKKILKMDSDRPDILLKLGQAYKYKRDYVRANRVFGYIIKRYENTPYKEKALLEMVNDQPSTFNVKSEAKDKYAFKESGKTKKLAKEKEVTSDSRSVAVSVSKDKETPDVERKSQEVAVTEKAKTEEVKKTETKAEAKAVSTVIAKNEKEKSTQEDNISSKKGEVVAIKKEVESSKKEIVQSEKVEVAGNIPQESGSEAGIKNQVVAKVDETKKEDLKEKLEAVTDKIAGNIGKTLKDSVTEMKKEKVEKVTQQIAKIGAKSVMEVAQAAKKVSESEAKPTSIISNVAVAAMGGPVFSDEKLVTHYYRKGNEYYMQGEYRKAVVLYQKVLERRPNSIGIRFILGNNYILMGDYENARKMYEEIIAKDPTGSYGVKARILLNKLEKNLK